MTDHQTQTPARPSRRTLLRYGAAAAVGMGAGAAVGAGLAHAGEDGDGASTASEAAEPDDQVVPFHGTHQAGVVTVAQAHATFVALTLGNAATRDDLRRLLRSWTLDAARLTRGIPTLSDPQPDLAGPPSRLTVTVGLGRGALERTGLADRAPAWLAPLPAFGTDRLRADYSGGDLLAQVCADDPIVLAHAVRALLIGASGIATVHWQQRGFRRPASSSGAMRNLMGQVDGTVQPHPDELDALLWVGEEAPGWLRGGTSLVLRRIAMNLDTWDELDGAAKESVIGRRLSSGAPLTGNQESDAADLSATKDGLFVIPQFAHIRAAAATGPTDKILRRPYNYDDTPAGPATAQSGLLFAAYQRDPLAQFVPIQRRIDARDLLSTWTTPIGSAVFALLPGCPEGGYLGQTLLD
ncbi:MAG: Dyp-type peroxidase [Dermatophilaceae bacterium]